MGTYARWGWSVYVTPEGKRLRVASVDRHQRAWYPLDSREFDADLAAEREARAETTAALAPVDAHRFVRTGTGPIDTENFLTFVDTDGDGRPDYLFDFGRAHRRTA